MIREKRSKKRNDGAQSANIAPDQYDSQEQNEFSQTAPTVNLDSEQYQEKIPESTVKYFRKRKIFPRKTFKTPPVATSDSELQIVEFRQETPSQPLEVFVQEELIRDDFIYVPPQNETQQTSNNDCPSEPEKQGVTVSLTSSVIEELIKHDYVYEVSDEDHAKEQQQLSQETPLPSEPKKQDVTVSLTSSIIEEFFEDDYVYEVSDEEQQQQSQEPPVARQSEQETLILSSFDSAAQPREREDERPSFNLGISPLTSQPSQPSQPTISQLEILEEAVVDAGVTATLKFAEVTSSEQTLPAAQEACHT
ncbi:uncharacterized protein DS421_2g45570 [Arachis hypogaea]|nr:uncharacterized protein DS421_2g45570 [Arachis hypogaea]